MDAMIARWVAGLLAASAWATVARGLEEEATLGQRLAEAAGARGGICVLVGVGDGKLAVDLAQTPQFYVHGLALADESLDAARRHVAAEGLAARVGLVAGGLKPLPYADNLVNLLVIERLDAVIGCGLTAEEVLRVLAPGGVALLSDPQVPAARRQKELLADAGFPSFEPAKDLPNWAVVRKPRPAGMDDWTHARHDAAGSGVSADTLVGPPRRLQWYAGPAWPKTHPGGPAAVREAGGRFFCVFDEATAFSNEPSRQALIARDAFNGSLLWKRPVGREADAGSAKAPRFDGRTFVAAADRVYAVLEPGGPLQALDAATGRTLATFDKLGPPRRVLMADGCLLIATDGRLLRMYPVTGEVLWEQEVPQYEMALAGGQVIVLTREDGYTLYSFDWATGRRQWKAPTAPHAPQGRRSLVLCFVADGRIILGDGYAGSHNYAFAADDGRFLWQYEYHPAGACADVFPIDGLLWVNVGGKDPQWRGLDPKTAELKRTIDYLAGVSRGHARCHLNVATARYFLTGIKDFECVRVADGDFFNVRSARGSCGAGGVLPANGLVYTFPHPCTCLRPLRGFAAAAAGPVPGDPDCTAAEPLLQRGPAFDRPPPAAADAADDWPMYRHDFRRSAATAASLPAKLAPAWKADLPGLGPLTPPTVAAGKVFVAATDAHQVIALDAATGAKLWTFTADGRVDTPPTVCGGLALFGSNDGWVYCLDAADGSLRWRLRAGPGERLIAADGQVESAWPVHGSVLVLDGVAYILAGRHTHLDGGMWACAARLEDGRVLWRTRAPGEGAADLLTSDGRLAYWFDAGFAPADGAAGFNWRSLRLRPARGTVGMLERQWSRRGGPAQSDGRDLGGDLVAFTAHQSFAVNAFPDAKGRDSLISLGKEGWRISAAAYQTSEGGGAKAAPRWDQLVRLRMRSMVLAGDALLVAGVSDTDPAAARLAAFAALDGAKRFELALDGECVDEGLAAAAGRLYAVMKDGSVRCFAAAVKP